MPDPIKHTLIERGQDSFSIRNKTVINKGVNEHYKSMKALKRTQKRRGRKEAKKSRITEQSKVKEKTLNDRRRENDGSQN